MPQQHPFAVCGFLELGTGDVAVHPHHVEAGLGRSGQVVGDHRRFEVCEESTLWSKTDAFGEQPFAIERELHVVQVDAAQACSPVPSIAYIVVGVPYGYRYFVKRLGAQ